MVSRWLWESCCSSQWVWLYATLVVHSSFYCNEQKIPIALTNQNLAPISYICVHSSCCLHCLPAFPFQIAYLCLPFQIISQVNNTQCIMNFVECRVVFFYHTKLWLVRDLYSEILSWGQLLPNVSIIFTHGTLLICKQHFIDFKFFYNVIIRKNFSRPLKVILSLALIQYIYRYFVRVMQLLNILFYCCLFFMRN